MTPARTRRADMSRPSADRYYAANHGRVDQGGTVAYRLTVLGTGYLGTTHAACMAELGFEVLGMDVDADKVAALSRGEVTFYEPGLAELLTKHVAAGGLRFTDSYEEGAAFGDVPFLWCGSAQ